MIYEVVTEVRGRGYPILQLMNLWVGGDRDQDHDEKCDA